MTERIIFIDLDETLIDTSERHYRVYCDIINTLNLKNPISKNEFWKLKRKGVSTLGIIEENDPEILKQFSKLWINNIEKKNYLSHDKPFDSTFDLLNNLKNELFVLLSMRNNHENLIWQINELGLNNYFDEILSCSPIQYKDKTSILLNYIHSNNLVINNDFIIIGDSETDIITGKLLKLITIAVTYGIRTKKLLISHDPDYTIDNMDEIINLLKTL